MQAEEPSQAEMLELLDAMDYHPAGYRDRKDAEKNWRRFLEDLMDGSRDINSEDDFSGWLYAMDPWVLHHMLQKAVTADERVKLMQAELDSLHKAISEDARLERHATLAKLADHATKQADSYYRALQSARAYMSETRPIEGHSDPGALADMKRDVEEALATRT